ncbi:hypothetical protein PIROE2DRAFT_10707, partial [Piromyces sp. E2]
GAPTSWYPKVQHCVSTSTAESEALHLFNIKHLTINIDNKVAIYNSKKSINKSEKQTYGCKFSLYKRTGSE